MSRKGALYHYEENLFRPYDPEKAKQLLQQAGAEGLTLNHIVNAGDVVDEQIAVLLQQQLAQVGVTLNLQKMDASQTWNTEVEGNFDTAVNYWTNDIIDPDQKTTFVLGHDANMNYMTRYKNDTVKDLVYALSLIRRSARACIKRYRRSPKMMCIGSICITAHTSMVAGRT